jgi:hypothetical protein
MVTWLFRQLLSLFDDDIGSDVGDERNSIPSQRNRSGIPDDVGSPRLDGQPRLESEPREDQRSVT